MTEEWDSGFTAGVLWASGYVAHAADRPTLGAELCREGGIKLRELKQRDAVDQEIVNAIVREYLEREGQ